MDSKTAHTLFFEESDDIFKAMKLHCLLYCVITSVYGQRFLDKDKWKLTKTKPDSVFQFSCIHVAPTHYSCLKLLYIVFIQ